ADAATGRTKCTINCDKLPFPAHCIFSKDSSELFMMSRDARTFHRIDISTGKEVRAWQLPKARGVSSRMQKFDVAPDGKTLARGVGQGVRFFDLANDVEIGADSGQFAVRSVAFLPGGRTLLTQDETNMLRWWDLDSSK